MPSIYDQQIYQEVEEVLEKGRRVKSNVVLMSFEGAGGSYILKSYVKNHPEVKYIDGEGETLGEYSIIDTDIKTALNYLKTADLDQKMAFLIGSGTDFYSDEGKEIRAHGYITGVIGVRNKRDAEMMVEELGGKGFDSRSEGIAKLIKCLIVGDNEVFENLKIEIKKSLEGYSDEDLEKLGVTSGGLKIKFDLTLVEDGKELKEKVSEVEARILKTMQENKGEITKEKVSDIKWGEGKYDDYSDQAINKTMRRLNEKLSKYEIETIPKVGFVLKSK